MNSPNFQTKMGKHYVTVTVEQELVWHRLILLNKTAGTENWLVTNYVK